ncbi:uncharacterized protein N7498_004046 [Penicillium cinerascens]|uniref:Apple domain-containing protein n=1 Tax=Penicillium cinerascens TaxID=70096 RepID=A0A9W9N3E4_9EURO|nr:uncharacterized protein N7498_004046 [Penicillium cinerascens]KAJ5212400.1 hypothetical protein N7498_004046 [Penicillium cinerascens]
MLVTVIPFFVALLGLADAAPKKVNQPNRETQHHTSTKVSYQTSFGRQVYHGHVPTSTVRNTWFNPLPVIIFSTTHPTTTVTPPVVTVTETDYVTSIVSVTAAASTDVVSITSTEIDTETTTTTLDPVTSTISTDTTTTLTSTSTIPTPDGFTPLVDTFATPTTLKRDLSLLEDRSQKFDIADFKYTHSLRCTHEIVIEVIIIDLVVGKPITKTLRPQMTTEHTTSTITSTSTIVPADVSTTVTESVTSTISSTVTAPAVTTTTTSTYTVTVSTSTTFYDACATNNVAPSPLTSDYGSFEGQYIESVSSAQGSIRSGNGNSAYDCCVSCIQDSNCGISIYWASGTCYILDSATCSPTSIIGTVDTSTGYAGGSVSNGLCGRAVGGSSNN